MAYKDATTLAGTIVADMTAPPGEAADVAWIKNGEPAEQTKTNRPHQALAENCDIIKTSIDRHLASPEVYIWTLAAPAGSIIIDPSGGNTGVINYTGTLYCGETGWATQERLDQLFAVLDSDYNEVRVNDNEVKVTSISGGTLGNGFESVATTLNFNETLPAGSYRIGYYIGSSVATLPPYALTHAGLRGLEEVPGEDIPAENIAYSGGTTWHDGTTNPATDVESQLDKVITDLVADAGTDRIGSAAKTTGEFTWSAGSAKDQLLAIASEIEMLRRGAREASLRTALDVRPVVNVFGGVANAQVVAFSASPTSDALGDFPCWFFLGENSSTGVAYVAKYTHMPEETAGALAAGSISGTAWDQANDMHWGYNYTTNADYLAAVGRISSSGGAAVAYSAGPSVAMTGGTVTGHTGANDVANAVIWDHVNEYWIIGGDDGTNGWIARQASVPSGSWSAPTTFPGSTTSIFGLGYDGNGTVMATTRIPTNGVILKSTDGGDTWSTVLSEATEFAFYGIHYNTRLGMWFAMGDSYSVWRSADDGVTWVKGATAAQLFNVSLAVDEEGVLYTFDAKNVHYSVDLGDTWSAHNRLDSDDVWLTPEYLYRHHKAIAFRNGYMFYGGWNPTGGSVEYYMLSKRFLSHNALGVSGSDPEFFIQ